MDRLSEPFHIKQLTDDEMRHHLALLSFPPQKIWEEADLKDEISMEAGLHLLYNEISDKETIQFSKSNK